MDVEDWYHLDYFQDKSPDKTRSMLDGFLNYIEILNAHNLKTTFFVLSELSEAAKEYILYADKCGHEIACHGKDHTRPLTMEVDSFKRELIEAKEVLSNLIGKEIIGYRAPCYSINKERYDILKEVGFKYSSSKMDILNHPLYGDLELGEQDKIAPLLYRKNGLTEIALNTERILGINIAVSGGGWIRLFPWYCFMKPVLKNHLTKNEIYTFYIHPFELSKTKMPKVEGISQITKIRAKKGLGSVETKIEQLIVMLQDKDFRIVTFREMINDMEGCDWYQSFNCR